MEPRGRISPYDTGLWKDAHKEYLDSFLHSFTLPSHLPTCIHVHYFVLFGTDPEAGC